MSDRDVIEKAKASIDNPSGNKCGPGYCYCDGFSDGVRALAEKWAEWEDVHSLPEWAE